MNNAIDQYLLERPTPFEQRQWREAFDPAPEPLTAQERADWIAKMDSAIPSTGPPSPASGTWFSRATRPATISSSRRATSTAW